MLAIAKVPSLDAMVSGVDLRRRGRVCFDLRLLQSICSRGSTCRELQDQVFPSLPLRVASRVLWSVQLEQMFFLF